MNNNVQILNDMEKCTGCGACKNICPCNAIEMKEGFRTFFYPIIDNIKCIHCLQCKKVCPVLNVQKNNDNNPLIIAAQAKDEVRKKSSSGGMYPLFAKKIIKEKNGTVFCTKLDENFNAVFCEITDLEDVHKGSDSKYVQSDTRYIYREIQNKLKNDKIVLFIGCPCQVAGLKNFLRKDYYNLYTIDLLCHGVPSPRMLKDYIKEKAEEGAIVNVKFRDKSIGWRADVISTYWKNGTVTRYFMKNNDEYELAFQYNLNLRSSCENCVFCEFPRVGDVSIGDFWHINEHIHVDILGTSLVFVNNEKGKELIDIAREEMKMCQILPISKEKIKNRIWAYFPPKKEKKYFFELYPRKGFIIAVREAMKEVIQKNDYQIKLNKEDLEKKNKDKLSFTSIGDLGLGEGCSINEVIRRMPTNSTLCQVQGNYNLPIADTPVPYGVLTIVKTSDYFVQIIFTRMTVGEIPEIYQAQWKDNRVVRWIRFISDQEFFMFKEKTEKEIESLKKLIEEKKYKIFK